VEQSRLHLRLKRPVVAISILQDTGVLGVEGEGWLLPDRVLPFLRAGASAVVGPWWPTSEAADRIFWPRFYELLYHRLPLGEVVWRARQAVRDALPDSLDGLAYTLFGDPRARAYWPDPSGGYMTLELDSERDGTLRPNRSYALHARVSRRPPEWYHERLVNADSLPDHIQVRFLTLGLAGEDSTNESQELRPAGRTTLQATTDIVATEPGDYLVMAQFLDGNESIKTLQLSIEVRGEERQIPHG
jgi:hypothetical protein